MGKGNASNETICIHESMVTMFFYSDMIDGSNNSNFIYVLTWYHSVKGIKEPYSKKSLLLCSMRGQRNSKYEHFPQYMQLQNIGNFDFRSKHEFEKLNAFVYMNIYLENPTM